MRWKEGRNSPSKLAFHKCEGERAAHIRRKAGTSQIGLPIG
jgi:hypothetical protein